MTKSIPQTTDCGRCGGQTYTYGMPLPGQSLPLPGQYDDRERTNRKCIKCGAEWGPAKPPQSKRKI